MNNIERLQHEIQDIDLAHGVLSIYLLESGIEPLATYEPTNKVNHKAILMAALGALESLANNPAMMKNVKIDDMTVSSFSENLMARIDQLQNKIRTFKVDDNGNSSTFMLYL